MNTLREIWWKIYPNDDEHRWMPILWLPFMIWFFIDPLWSKAGVLHWIGNTIFGLIFIWLYLYSFSHPEPRKFYAVLGLGVMAASLVLSHQGAVSGLLVYFVASGAFTTRLIRALSIIA